MIPKDLLARAYARLDGNDFDGAVALYRQFVAMAEPNTSVLCNLAIAREEGWLALLRNLVASYPESLPCRLALISAVTESRSAGHAVRLATDAILDFPEEATLQLRLARLVAAQKAGNFDHWVTDFEAIWHCETDGRFQFRDSLVLGISTLTQRTAIGALDKLRDAVALPLGVVQLIDSKIVELKILAELGY